MLSFLPAEVTYGYPSMSSIVLVLGFVDANLGFVIVCDSVMVSDFKFQIDDYLCGGFTR
jgi:hypothetical protein